MRLPLYLLIITALFTGIGAKAQAEQAASAVPVDFQGIWAAADCGHYDEALVLTQYFYLSATESSLSFSPVYTARGGQDYSILTFEGKDHPVTRTEDGLLKVAAPASAAPLKWPALWDDAAKAGRMEYTGCFDTPTLLPPAVAQALPQLDSLHTACGRTMTAECKAALFSIADGDKNGKLSLTEFRTAGAALGTFSALITAGSVLSPDMVAAHDSGAEQALRAGQSLMPRRDRDGDGNLTMQELAGFMKELDAPELKAAVAQAGRLFPALR